MCLLLKIWNQITKARQVAERALQTIHFREYSEKKNVWLAYLNLENMHGSPNPQEAVLNLFQRAVQVHIDVHVMDIFP